MDAERSAAWLRAGVAFVWLATGALALHPAYRAAGAAELGRVPGLGGATWLMFATCAAEVALGARVLLGRSAAWLVALELGMVATFTAVLAVTQPMLLASPFGVLTKNVPFAACVLAAHRIERAGWDARAEWILRAGMAAIWLTEGLLPKVLFQQPVELAIAARSVPWLAPPVALRAIGAVEVASGVLALSLRGRALGLVLAAQAGALAVLAIVMTRLDASLWLHPFGPLTKNAPILIGTLVLRARLARGAA